MKLWMWGTYIVFAYLSKFDRECVSKKKTQSLKVGLKIIPLKKKKP